MTKKKDGEPSQLDKFKALAKEADCDLDAEAMDKAIGSVGKTPPTSRKEALRDAEKKRE